jgi:hypothetical protein
MFGFDSTGINPDERGGGKLLPKRWFDLEIIEHVSKDGKTYPMEGYTNEAKYPKVDILVKVINDPEYNDERIFHTVTFMPKDKKGAGMAIHFLKSIGQPWEGKFQVASNNWVGCQFKGYVITDEYKGKTKNKIGEIKPMEEVKESIPF